MSETKQLLERAKAAFEPPSDVMDALVVRRDRRQRDRRIRAGVLGLAIAIGVGWLGVIAIRSAPPVPAEPPNLPSTPESWSRVQLDPPVDGGAAANFLVAGPDGLTAVGVHEGPATAWTSAEGATWTRTAAGDLDGAHISDITSGGPGFIASEDSGGGEARAIWTSEDGLSWNRLPDPDFGDTLFISAVAPGGPGQVAVGSWMGAWYSSDGVTWERASVPPLPPEIYPGDNGNTPQIYLTDVAAQGDRLVATGWGMLASDGNLDHPVVVVWTSRDGRSWTDVPTPADVFPPDSSISDITAGPDGFVAVGQITIGEVSTPAIWSSPDGRDWRLHRPGPDGLVLSSVAAGDGGYVAVGATMACSDPADCASREAVVMTSVDGETWVRVPSGPEFRVAQPGDPENAPGAAMSEVVAWGSRFAALGEYDGEATVWVTTAGVQEDITTPGETPEPAPPGSRALAYEIDGDIYVADADGSNAVRIADGDPLDGGNDNCARYGLSGEAWSPDGRYLAYWDHGCPVPGAWGTVLITDPEGTLIGSFPGEGWANSWSPDSTRVAVWDSWGGPGDATIGVYGIDGVRQATLTVPRELMPSGDQSPAWSRDGSSILLPGLQVPLDGSPPQPFDITLPGYPVYSPDGSSVAYLDDGSLVVVPADGPDAQEMDPPEIWYAAWSPNGDLVAFTADETELLVRDVATGADTSLVDVTGSERLSVIEFSPDGDRILFTRWDADTGRSSLWSIGSDGSDLRRLVDGVGWADLQPQGRPS